MKLRVSVAACWAGLAAVLAHVLSYQVSYSDPHARMHALEASGHSWYGLLVPAVLAMVLVAVAGTFVAARRSVRAVSALQMYALSAAGFLAVEFAERYVHLGSLGEVWHNVSTGSGFVPVLLALALLLPLVPLFYFAAKAVTSLASRATRITAPLEWKFRTPEINLVSITSLAPAPRGPPRVPAQVSALR